MGPDVCVVVPTIRDFGNLRSYFANARDHGFDLGRLHVVLVTEDFCDTRAMSRMLDEEGVSGDVFDGRERDRWLDEHGLEDYGHLVPAASHAQTSFGLVYLWANGFEYGVFIDDDTRPHPAFDFFGTHLATLSYAGAIERVRSDTRWVNVLDSTGTGVYPRGYPYGAMGETVVRDTTTVDDVVASQGLWTEVPDLDAVRILAEGDPDGRGRTRLGAADYGADFVAARGHYLTVCSMNLAFRREVVPAFYQLPMDDNPWDIGRFDDIWSGVILKRVCDLLDKDLVSGAPLCEHHKAPRSTFDDLAAEAPALELNEHLWEVVDAAGAGASTYSGAYRAIADALGTSGDGLANGAFLPFMAEAMHDWLDCLDRIEPSDREPATAATADD